MKRRVTRGIATDVPNWGTPAGQLPAGSLRFPIGSKDALLRQICRTGYTQKQHRTRRAWPNTSASATRRLDTREMDQSSRGRPEAARLKIERLELRFKVNEHPLASRCLSLVDSASHDGRPKAMALMTWARLGVDQERVIPTIPGNVHEPHQETVLIAGHNPT